MIIHILIKMKSDYFESIERHCQECKSMNVIPNRRCLINKIHGKEIEKRGKRIPYDTLERMVNGSNEKYLRTTEKLKHQILNSKRKGIVKYQTLGWKQAKEIKLWCEQNNIQCDIVEDTKVVRNKLDNINIWFDSDGRLYDDGCRDYGRQYLDFQYKKQQVVYIQINK